MRQNNSFQFQKKRKKTGLGLFLILALLILSASAVAGYQFYVFAMTPMDESEDAVLVVVSPGQGLNATTHLLWKNNLISSSAKFKILAAVTGKEKKIKAGEYQVSSSMSPWDILTILVEARVYLHKVTIPEGFTLYQIGRALSDAELCTEKAFIAVATDPEKVRQMAIGDSIQTFEGYLFPDTYYFPRNVKPVTVIRTMVERFRSIYKKEWYERANTLGLSQHQVLTLASIIEKETGVPSERPLISSVFHNRLKKNMRLETDPTVIYGIKDFDGNLTKKHLRTETPYNTYRRKGLPPGPIANPGLASIEAALYPADSPYLYFVAKKDSTHQFSTNIRDHINSVRKYQLRK